MNSAIASETPMVLNVGVVARGSHCVAIMKSIQTIQSSRLRLRLVAIAIVQESAPCYKYAAGMGFEVFEDYHDLLSLENLNMILELTGEEAILSDIISRKQPTVSVLDRHASKLLFDMVKMHSKEDRGESEDTLATSFASALLDGSPDGVLVIDKKYRIINSNRSPLIPGSADRGAILGKHCFEVMNRSSSPCHGTLLSCPAVETLKTGKLARTVYETSCPGNPAQLRQVTAYPIFNRRGEVDQFVLTIRDMTKDLNKRIEQRTQVIKKDLARVAQEERLTSLGRLVASVCHEINNPITSIVTFTKLVLSMIRQGELSSEEIVKAERYLDLSFREAMRCGGIVKNLLTFARPKGMEPKTVDILEVVNTILLLTGHQLELANVRPIIDLPPAPFTAWGDYAQIQQCLLNLIFNAIDAMPAGGTIIISGGTEEAADLIWLAVSDTGHGIESNELQQIFEPFYSTKADGKGVGLGLSMVYGIVQEHKGVIEVDSEPGKGTTFKIKLPKSPMTDREVEHVPSVAFRVSSPARPQKRASRPSAERKGTSV